MDGMPSVASAWEAPATAACLSSTAQAQEGESAAHSPRERVPMPLGRPQIGRAPRLYRKIYRFPLKFTAPWTPACALPAKCFNLQHLSGCHSCRKRAVQKVAETGAKVPAASHYFTGSTVNRSGNRHHGIVESEWVLDRRVDLAQFWHQRHRHAVFQAFTAFAWLDNHYSERAGWRFLGSNLERALAGTGIDNKHHAVGSTRARSAFALVKHNRQFARLGVETLHCVFEDDRGVAQPTDRGRASLRLSRRDRAQAQLGGRGAQRFAAGGDWG
jgi:hypothetical protein